MRVQIQNRNLEEITKELLDHLVPPTEDKGLLNELTTRQIINSTYIENVLPRNSSDANILVPQSLYECKTNQVWRYPPHMTIDFLVRKARGIKLKISGGFGVPRFFVYGEHKIDTADRTFPRYISNPKIKTPKDFSKISFEGINYDLKDQEAFKPKSVTPEYYEFNTEIALDGILKKESRVEYPLEVSETKQVVKKYDEVSNKLDVALSKAGEIEKELDRNSINKNIKKEDTRIAYIDLISGKISLKLLVEVEDVSQKGVDYHRVTIRLINVNKYSTTRPSDFQWRKLSVVFPYFFIGIENTEFIIPPQQHADVLKASLLGKENIKTDELLCSYTQINCVLAQSTKDENTLVCTMFGVYDTIREDPLPGPEIDFITANVDNLISEMNILSDKQKGEIQRDKNLSSIVIGVLKSVKKSFQISTLYKYQWEAIQYRIQILLDGKEGTTTIIKAPTGAGKTVVFMVNAILYSLITGKRSVMVFPTRILNEDMFKRLTRFIYTLRKKLKNENITGGIFIGSYDPLYNAVARPELGKEMIQYDQCPKCNKKGSIIAQDIENRTIGVCNNCGHHINYMYGPREVSDYLPMITIATPDKLFYDATASAYEDYALRFFGGYYKKCHCGYCIPVMNPRDIYKECRKCKSKIEISNPENSPIGYFVFDEVHSLYGLTSILLSIFLKTLTLMYNKIIGHNYYKTGFLNKPTFETGTATIANEIELLSKITRSPEENIHSFPDDLNRHEYFKLNENRVRYRTLVLLPVAKSARTTVSNSLLQTYIDFHKGETLKNKLRDITKHDVGDYDFILGYLYRKSDGYTLRRTLRDLSRQTLNKTLNVEFLSGDSTTTTVARLFKQALRGDIQILLANLVISLGIDIANLNNMIMMGVPKSMTEQVQTAGRTGRGDVPGHVTIHLLPSNPRDMFLYENFHVVFSDVKGYYDRKPVESTNAYAAQIMLPNVLKSVLATQSYHQYVLTAPSLSRYLGGDKRRKNLILYDIISTMTEDITPRGIRDEIFRLVAQDLNEYIRKWSGLHGPGHYISTILQDEKEILTSLRARTSRDVDVQVTDIELYSKIEHQRKSPLSGRFGSLEEESTDLTYDNLEEG